MSRIDAPQPASPPRQLAEVQDGTDLAREAVQPQIDDIDMLFVRNGFDRRTKDVCDDFARLRFPIAMVTTPKSQGYCSYTLAISDCYLLQFRPEAYRLNMDICKAAEDIFSGFAPNTTFLGTVQGIPHDSEDIGKAQLHVYLQQNMPGVTLSEFQKIRKTSNDERTCRRRLVQDLADVFALSFDRRLRDGFESFTKGQIGSSLQLRLGLLGGLRGKEAKNKVYQLQRDIESIERMPWCLTHGDLIPANILVDQASGHLTGLIDWAEGEWLPFGVGLYGLEEILGEEMPNEGFQYYPEHEQLRKLFWIRFFDKSTQTYDDLPSSHEIRAARELGILLWRGIAFDDGRIDRVAMPGMDDSELHKLDLFLSAKEPGSLSRASSKGHSSTRLI